MPNQIEIAAWIAADTTFGSSDSQQLSAAGISDGESSDISTSEHVSEF